MRQVSKTPQKSTGGLHFFPSGSKMNFGNIKNAAGRKRCQPFAPLCLSATTTQHIRLLTKPRNHYTRFHVSFQVRPFSGIVSFGKIKCVSIPQPKRGKRMPADLHFSLICTSAANRPSWQAGDTRKIFGKGIPYFPVRLFGYKANV